MGCVLHSQQRVTGEDIWGKAEQERLEETTPNPQ